MFILSLTYQKPLEEVEKHIQEHIAFLDKYYALQKFICSGRKNPRTGGIILANNVTEPELREIIKEDPFWKHEIASFELIEFLPTKFDKNFEVFV